MVNELSKKVGMIAREQQSMKQGLAPYGDTPAILVLDAGSMDLTLVNVVLTKVDLSSSNTFVVGHETNGIIGTANGLGGGQIVIGDDGNQVSSDLVRRRYAWRTESDLNEGTYSSNITVDGGKIQLG